MISEARLVQSYHAPNLSGSSYKWYRVALLVSYLLPRAGHVLTGSPASATRSDTLSAWATVYLHNLPIRIKLPVAAA